MKPIYLSIQQQETGENIRRLLKSNGYTVKDIQEVMGFENPQAVYKWLSGKSLPSLENLLILSKLLNISIENILVIDEDINILRSINTQWIKITDKELLAIHEKRLRRILDVALSNKVETIVLGAFGCGAFMNNPNVVAQASKNVLNEYLYAFKNIEFAVYCSPSDDTNYRIFDRVFRPYTK